MDKHQRYRNKDIEAYRARKREYAKTQEQREKRAAYMRKWREANREKFNRQARESHHRNKHKHVSKRRDQYLRSTYGISAEDFDAMLTEQNGCCAICGNKDDGRRLHVDHCHTTGKVRGLLCSPCNTKLGWLELRRKEIANYMQGDIVW